jgi:four helix bundle protein
MGEPSDSLHRRISEFSVAVLRFVRRLPEGLAADSIIGHVARSAAGMGVNYRAAARLPRSSQEFISAVSEALEQAEETDRWLWMAMHLNLGSAQELVRLAREARELRGALAILVSVARREASGGRAPR